MFGFCACFVVDVGVLVAIVCILTSLAVWSAQRVRGIRLCGCMCSFGLDLARVAISSVH